MAESDPVLDAIFLSLYAAWGWGIVAFVLALLPGRVTWELAVLTGIPVHLVVAGLLAVTAVKVPEAWSVVGSMFAVPAALAFLVGRLDGAALGWVVACLATGLLGGGFALFFTVPLAFTTALVNWSEP